MPILRTLDEEEVKIYLHLINNKKTINAAEQTTRDLIDEACDTSKAEKLAKISEDAKFAQKNRYKHD